MAEDQPVNAPVAGPDRPLVTLAVFAFNQQDYIGEALAGALSQTYGPLEIQIVDDCSADETVAMIEAAVADYAGPHEVSVHRNPENLGWARFGRHFNTVVERARGDLIVLAAGDDISKPERVERLVEAWLDAGKPSAVVMCAFETTSDDPAHSGKIRHDGRDFGAQTLVDLVRHDGGGILGAAIGFTSDLYTEFGPLPEETVFEDRVLGFRALLAGKVLYLDDPLVRYRIHGANVSGPNIYADSARWERFCRGHRALFAAFRADYQHIHAGETGDPRVLDEIDARARHVRRTEKLVSGSPFERVAAAWHVTEKQHNWRYRLSFILKAAGLRHAFDRLRPRRPEGRPQDTERTLGK